MYNISLFLILTLLCILSSILGICIGTFFTKSAQSIGSIYYFTAGIMNSIICFEMIPETINSLGIIHTIILLVVGVGIIIFLESKNRYSTNVASYVMIVSMATHNILEGFIIGTIFSISYSIGKNIFITMFLHDIPETMSVYMVNRDNKYLAIKSSIIVGTVTSIGILGGMMIGNTYKIINGYILGIASGAMLYIVSNVLIPKSFESKNNKSSYLSYVLGIIIGVIIKNI